MFAQTKRALDLILGTATFIIDSGQKFLCNRFHNKMIAGLGLSDNTDIESYATYNAKLESHGLKASRSDFVLFSRPIIEKGNDPSEIVPAYILHNIVNPSLNPLVDRGFYEDKNMFDRIFPAGVCPTSYLRRINGHWYDKMYNPMPDLTANSFSKVLQDSERVIVKPSVESSSGKNIEIFDRQGDRFVGRSSDSTLSPEYIVENYGDNCVVQEVLTQDGHIGRFNPTSINTLRMVIYRSVKDNRPHLLWTIMRIGGKGSFVDNAHAGGVYIGINPDGRLNNYACDQYGHRYPSHNDISFADNRFTIPDFDKITEFVKEMSHCISHHRLIAFDVMVDGNGAYRIIEFNIRGYSGWLGQFSGFPALGDKADEILRFCTNNRGKKSIYCIG